MKKALLFTAGFVGFYLVYVTFFLDRKPIGAKPLDTPSTT